MLRRWFVFTVMVLVGGIVIGTVKAQVEHEIAQVVLSPTPVRVVIPTVTPLPVIGEEQPTIIPATFTPTAAGPAQLQAREEAGPVNVRSEASTESDILGSIRHGEQFAVMGRYYRWFQFRFDPSPSGFGYVYDELVEIIGDEANIPDLTESLLPTPDTSVINATETAEVILSIPGGELTLTADAVIIELPSGERAAGNPQANAMNDVPVPLPTFTYPPNIVAMAPTLAVIEEVTVTPDPTVLSLAVSEGVAPIVPIVILGGLGIVGLLFSAMRR